MMESIEKLRRYVEGSMNPSQYTLLAMLYEIEREIAERYMELPTDADGVPIKVGDECWGKDTAERFEVSSIEWNGVCWSVWSVPETRHLANKVLHHRPRTIEDVLRDFVAKVNEPQLGSIDHRVEEYAPKYAAEIREIMVME